MKKTVKALALGMLIISVPLFAHKGEHYYGYDDHGPYRERCDGRWCLGSEWCLSQAPNHQHTERCYYRVAEDGYRDKGPRPIDRNGKRDDDYKDYKPSKIDAAKMGRVTIGEVSGVDTNASTITLTNADGEKQVVHISSFTRLIVPLSARASVNDETAQSGLNGRVNGPAPSPRRATIEDIKNGSSVLVSVFDTGTKTLEAARVIVEP